MNLSFSREPAAWIAVIKALLYMVALFGVKVTTEQMAGIVFFFEAVGALIQRQTSFAPTSKEGDKLVGVQYEGRPVEAVK